MLTEVRRVLRDGFLYIAEPLAKGPSYEVSLLYHDETEVRQQAADILAAHAPTLFKRHQKASYHGRRIIGGGFEEYAAIMAATMRYNDFTEAQLRAPAVEERFRSVVARVGGVFDQPVRVDLLRP